VRRLETQPALRAEDDFGNASTTGLAASLNVTINLQSGTGTLQGTVTKDIGTGAGNGTVSYTNLRIDSAGSKVLRASTPGDVLAHADSNSFTVAAATATKLVYTTQPGGATAGAPFGTQPALRAEDDFGNASTTGLAASLNVTISLQSGTGTLQGTVTKDIGTGAGNGTVSYTNLRIDSAGSKVLRASTPGDVLARADSNSFTVTPAPADRLVFTTQPGGATAGAAFGTQPVVRSRDPYGNDSTVGLPASRIVTVALTSGTGPLQGTAMLDIGTGAATPGEATFTNLRIDSAGAGKVLTASASYLASAVSDSFAVAAAPADRLVFTTQPGNAIAGAAFATQPVVKSRDAYGNDSTVGLGATKNVTVALTSGSGILQGTAMINIGTGGSTPGIATFSNLRIDTAGSGKVLTASASYLTSAVSDVFTVLPDVAAKLKITGAATQIAGTPQNLTITAYDLFGNVATGYAGDKSLTFSGANPSGVFNPTVTDKTGTAVSFAFTTGNPTAIAFVGGVAGVPPATPNVLVDAVSSRNGNHRSCWAQAERIRNHQRDRRRWTNREGGSRVRRSRRRRLLHWPKLRVDEWADEYVRIAHPLGESEELLRDDGDIRTATVSFGFRDATGSVTPISGAQNLPVGLIDPNDTSRGTATKIVTYNIGKSATSEDLQIAITIGGNYLLNNDPVNDGLVLVAKPPSGNAILGEQKIANGTGATNLTRGFLKGADSKKTTLSLDVLYSKSGANPQGRVTATVYSWYKPDGTLDTTRHTYKIKSTSISLLAANTDQTAGDNYGRAQFSAKANVQELLPNGTLVSIDGGATMQITVKDGHPATLSTPGDGDLVSIYILNKSGGVWFANQLDSESKGGRAASRAIPRQ
jgi:hypothetical protein